MTVYITASRASRPPTARGSTGCTRRPFEKRVWREATGYWDAWPSALRGAVSSI